MDSWGEGSQPPSQELEDLESTAQSAHPADPGRIPGRQTVFRILST